MLRKTVSSVVLFLLAANILAFVFEIQLVNANVTTITINADGSITPSTSPISTVDNTTYTFTNNISGSIVVDRDNITVDGNGYTLLGGGNGTGIDLTKRSNVIVKNLNIRGFNEGIGAWNDDWYDRSHGLTIEMNNISGNYFGIHIRYVSENSTIAHNNISDNNASGIYLSVTGSQVFGTGTFIVGNVMTNSQFQTAIDVSQFWGGGISNNYITGSIGYGIYLGSSSYNQISSNYVSGGSMYGIWLESSTNNDILYNNITANGRDGLHLSNYASTNNVVGNTISGNAWNGIVVDVSSYNTVFHNNVINNAQDPVRVSASYPYAPTVGNSWDDGYPVGGNFWSNYGGNDSFSGPFQNITGSDGIGDTPFQGLDNYPLMNPIIAFGAGSWNGTVYAVDIISNSTVSNMQVDTADKIVRFNVIGPESTTGFCRVTIPNAIAQELWHGNYTVLLNDEPWSFENWTDANNTCIFINYAHSEHQVRIIPEFPATMTLPLFMAVSMLAVVLARRTRLRLCRKLKG